MKYRFFVILTVFCFVSACSDFKRTISRTNLLKSEGPHLVQGEIDAYKQGIDTLRSFYTTIGIIDDDGILKLKTTPVSQTQQAQQLTGRKGLPDGMTKQDLVAVREGIFAYIDERCDAYIDAIFWAKRTHSGGISANSALAGATGAVVGATGGSARVLTIIAAAFGLSGNLFDAYYETVLYDLEPSGIQRLVDLARTRYRENSNLAGDITSEAVLLHQVQGYIRVCTPAYIEFLVNASVKTADVVNLSKGKSQTLLLIGDFVVKADGTVIGPDDTVYPPFGMPKLSESGAGFELVGDGELKIGGKTLKLNGGWKEPAPADDTQPPAPAPAAVVPPSTPAPSADTSPPASRNETPSIGSNSVQPFNALDVQ